MGDTVRRDYEGLLCDMVVMPKLDLVLSADEFRELLVQDMEDLGEDGKVSWILLLGYSVRHLLWTLDCRIQACSAQS